MKATGQLGGPGEFFNVSSKKYANSSGPDDTTHRVNVARATTTPNGVFALKLFPAHLEGAVRDVPLWDLFPAPIFVRVFRDDLLGQAISLVRARQTDQWGSRGVEPTRDAIYSSQEIEQALVDITNENARWDRYFARNQSKVLRVRYEDVERNHVDVLTDIANLAGVQLVSVPRLEDGGLTVQRDDLTELWRSKFVAEAGALDRIC